MDRKRGFTLVEVIMGIAILSVVMLAAFRLMTSVVNQYTKDNDSIRLQSEIEEISGLLEDLVIDADSVTVNSDNTVDVYQDNDYYHIYLQENDLLYQRYSKADGGYSAVRNAVYLGTYVETVTFTLSENETALFVDLSMKCNQATYDVSRKILLRNKTKDYSSDTETATADETAEASSASGAGADEQESSATTTTETATSTTEETTTTAEETTTTAEETTTKEETISSSDDVTTIYLTFTDSFFVNNQYWYLNYYGDDVTIIDAATGALLHFGTNNQVNFKTEDFKNHKKIKIVMKYKPTWGGVDGNCVGYGWYGNSYKLAIDTKACKTYNITFGDDNITTVNLTFTDNFLNNYSEWYLNYYGAYVVITDATTGTKLFSASEGQKNFSTSEYADHKKIIIQMIPNGNSASNVCVGYGSNGNDHKDAIDIKSKNTYDITFDYTSANTTSSLVACYNGQYQFTQNQRKLLMGDASVVITYSDQHDGWGDIAVGGTYKGGWLQTLIKNSSGTNKTINLSSSTIASLLGISKDDFKTFSYFHVEAYNGCTISKVEIVTK